MMAILTPVVGYVITAVQSGSLSINWHQVGLLALSGALAYLTKQLGTSTTITPAPGAPSAPVILTEKVMGVTVQNTNSANI